jgi:dUTP pyrophosphatase
MNLNIVMRKNGLRELNLHKPVLKFHKMHSGAKSLRFATTGSACFDVSASWEEGREITVYSPKDSTKTSVACDEITLNYGQRALVPTGLILDIPEGYSVRLFPRSGNAIGIGLTMINAVGVIDSDYKREVFVPLWNTSRHTISVRNGDRVCQGEMIQNEWYDFEELHESPSLDTEHGAGFGSTGGMSGH